MTTTSGSNEGGPLSLASCVSVSKMASASASSNSSFVGSATGDKPSFLVLMLGDNFHTQIFLNQPRVAAKPGFTSVLYASTSQLNLIKSKNRLSVSRKTTNRLSSCDTSDEKGGMTQQKPRSREVHLPLACFSLNMLELFHKPYCETKVVSLLCVCLTIIPNQFLYTTHFGEYLF